MIDRLQYAPDLIYKRYLDAFTELWGLSSSIAMKAGTLGNELFEAEFAYHGPKAYQHSLIVPIRNAKYSQYHIASRHNSFLAHHKFEPPILDYGCGVGFTLLWLKELGYAPSDLWGYDLPGPQEQVAKHVFEKEGVNFGIPPKVGTILCWHVLEHLSEPTATVDYLRSLGGRLYATCAWDKGHGHLVDEAKARTVIEYLREKDEFLNDHCIE